MKMSDFDLDTLRYQIESGGGFQIAITPVYPNLFEKVSREADLLHDKLDCAGFSVLMDDRNQKPHNMFQVVEFLGIPHRFTLSGRSLELGVYEYYHLESHFREKVRREDVLVFVNQIID